MKKFIGWILIIFCSFMLLIFAIGLIGIIPGVMDYSFMEKISTKEIITSSIGYFMSLLVFIFGLRKGLNNVKKDKVIEPIIYDKELNINLSGKIEYIDYRNLILGLSFKNPIYLISFGITLLFSMNYISYGENMNDQSGFKYLTFIFIGVFLISSIFTLVKIKNLYNSNSLFHEKLNYILTNESIQIKGDSIDSTQKWTRFYQFKESKKFFLFYQGKEIATLIDKKMFSEPDLKEFQNFIQSLNIKKI